MTFEEYYKSMNAKAKSEFARKLSTSVPYLSQIAHGYRKPGPLLAIMIVKATGNKVSKKSLRPDLWGK